jgi:hypothetical protein
MSIEETLSKSNPDEDKDVLEGDFDINPTGTTPFSLKKYLFIITAFLLVASASFGLGRISHIEEKRVPVTISSPEGKNLIQGSVEPPNPIPSVLGEVMGATTDGAVSGQVVGSKNGTKYHLLTCPGAKQISATNKIFFASAIEAQKAGYTPAANCKGLK